MKNIMKKAHKMTKEIRKEFPNVDYKFQLGLCLSFLYKNKKEGIKMEMAKLTGTEKQIKWAENLREEFTKACEELKEQLEAGKVSYKRRALTMSSATKNVEKFAEIAKDKKINKDNFIEILENIDTYKNKFLENETSSKFYIETRSYNFIETNYDENILTVAIKLLKAYIEY